ncbi:MAG: nitrogen fixation protein FixH [Marinosulfonomonas sp.]|nr:MAG: nitrogen fixation protein FixH [Marinosulfonomonas sp.]
MSTKELTGRKFFLIIASFFGVIITVNVFMAYQAVSTFPGLVTSNSYVASQTFNDERAAQLALGWDVKGVVADGVLTLSIVDSDANPVPVAKLDAILGRATHVSEDTTPAFEFDGTAYVAAVDLAPGNWNLRMIAIAQDGTQFRQRVVIQFQE